MHNDKKYRAVNVAEVKSCSGGWTITDSEGWSLFVTSEHCPIAPMPGEAVRMYGDGIGRPVRGIVIGHRVYRYQTEAEERAGWEAEKRLAKSRKAEEYEAKRAEHDGKVAALPAPLRERVEAFRERGGDEWRHEFEPYEVFACEQATVFADTLKTRAALVAFNRMPYEEQRAAVPGMSEEHSGNTFGMAVSLAAALIECPEFAPKMHGALCPLVGCETYGCWSTTAKVTA